MIGVTLLFLAGCNTTQQTAHQTPKDKIKEHHLHIGLIADPQYADKDDAGNRHYRASLAKLDSAIDHFNQLPVDFTVVMGDLIDESPDDLPPVLQRLYNLQTPVYKLLGNHDYSDAPDKKNVYRAFDMEAPYYTFEKENWVFVVLNTNEIAEYSTDAGTPPYREWEVLQKQLQAEDRKNARPYNGGISAKQLQWLEKQLEQATRSFKNIILFTHSPLLPENGLEALNNREILAVIEQYPNVRAVISGHHHPGEFAVYKGIPIITLEGMVETDQNAFGVLQLSPHQIEIVGKGRLTSRTFKF